MAPNGEGRLPTRTGLLRGKSCAWCPGRDSNSHALRRRPLKTVCLPVPPPGRSRERLPSIAPEILQGCFFDGAAGFAGGVCVFCAGTAAPPVAGAGAVCPVGTLGCVDPLSSDFFFSASCAAMLRRARSTESLCEDRQASVKDVTMKMIAQTVVTLLRKVTEPRPPKTVFADPPPPANAAIASPFPGWSRMTKMRKTLTTTWMVTTNANMRGARITWASVPGKPPFPEGLLASLVPAWQSRTNAGAARSSADQHRDPRLRRASVRLLRSHARPDDRGRLACGGSAFAQAARQSGGGRFRGNAGGQRREGKRRAARAAPPARIRLEGLRRAGGRRARHAPGDRTRWPRVPSPAPAIAAAPGPGARHARARIALRRPACISRLAVHRRGLALRHRVSAGGARGGGSGSRGTVRDERDRAAALAAPAPKARVCGYCLEAVQIM